jgi:hypothetical protein
MLFRVAAIGAGVFAYIIANGSAAASSWLPTWLGEAFNPPLSATTSVQEERRKALRAIKNTAKGKKKRTRHANIPKRAKSAALSKRAKSAARSRPAAHETRVKREQPSKTNDPTPARLSRSADSSIMVPRSDVSNETELASSRLPSGPLEFARNVNEPDDVVADPTPIVRALTLPADSETVSQKATWPEASQRRKPQASWWSWIWGSAAGPVRWYKIAEEVPACRRRDIIERFITIEGSDENAEKSRAELLRRPLLVGDCHVLPIGMEVTFKKDRLSGIVACIRTKTLTECFWTTKRAIEQREWHTAEDDGRPPPL